VIDYSTVATTRAPVVGDTLLNPSGTVWEVVAVDAAADGRPETFHLSTVPREWKRQAYLRELLLWKITS
jgi:hypothetical protein